MEIKAVLFDFGNTLVPFGEEQVEGIMRAFHEFLERESGQLDYETFRRQFLTLRDRQLAESSQTLKEIDFAEWTHFLIKQIARIDARDGAVARGMKALEDGFVNSISLPDYVPAFLGRLKKKIHVGLISNYPHARSVLRALEELDIRKYFELVVISGDVGHIKPHKVIFEKALAALSLPPGAVLFVGDSWHGDVLGARNAGMRAAHTRQWLAEQCPAPPGECIDGGMEDVLVVNHILELEKGDRLLF